jgi:hypothetical protein
MAAQTSLNDLIEALAGAVIEAQDRIERHQIENLQSYFNTNGRPKSITIKLPSMHPHAGEDDEDYYRAPLLPLVSTNLLKIKDVEISFDAELGELFEAPEPPAAVKAGERTDEQPPPPRKNIYVDTTSTRSRHKGGAVHVVLRVTGSEPTDGAARLINHLTQTQGVFKTVKME